MELFSTLDLLDWRVLPINKFTSTIFYKLLIIFKTRTTRILLFLVKHYTIKTDINRYYLSEKSPVN